MPASFSGRTPAIVLASHGFHLFDRRAVQIGTKAATALIDDPTGITIYETLFDNLERMAVFGDDARAALRRIAAEYQALSEDPGTQAAVSDVRRHSRLPEATPLELRG